MTPPEYAAAVAAEVRAEMARQHKTQAGLAKALGYTANPTALRLKGEKSFDLVELMRVALWLGVPVERFSPTVTDGAA